MSSPVNENAVQKLGLASYEMSISINLAQRAFKTLLKTCLGHHGLTIPQWTVLGHLYGSPTLRPNEVASILGIKPPYITKLINGMEAQGLVTSLVFADDGRGKTIALSSTGKQLVEQVEVKLEECLNDQLGTVRQADLQTYFTLTKYIAEHVRHHD